MLWIFLPLITVLADVGFSAKVSATLGCQPGWINFGVSCLRLFTTEMAWDSASRACEWYGSHLVKVKELDDSYDWRNLLLADDQAKEFWIALSGSLMTGDTVTVPYTTDTPMSRAHDVSQACVLARAVDKHVIWTLAPCERKSSFICTRPAAPEGCFHCTNEKFVLSSFVCDGENDCGDGSDEIDCESRCNYLLQKPKGMIFSPGWPGIYPESSRCFWMIQLPLGFNVRLQFTEFSTEPDVDVVTIYIGGPTVQTSHQVARLSGDLNETSLPTFISDNNFLLLSFESRVTLNRRGFSAFFTAVQAAGFPTRQKRLKATREVTDLFSPLYPGYLAWQDYTWVITANQEHETISLEILETDLKGYDRIIIRDGETAYATLLEEVTSSSRDYLPYVLSTDRHLYITMQTRGPDTGKGFYFRYWQGCSMKASTINGTIRSPGFQKGRGQYGISQSCIYDVTIPELRTVTIQFEHLDLHESDYLMLYESDFLLINVTGMSSVSPFDVSSGHFRVIFESDESYTSSGFSLTYSVGCPKLMFDSYTSIDPRLYVYRYGAKVTLSCVQGFAFYDSDSIPGVQEAPSLDTLAMECLEGGVWNVSEVPSCMLRCPPGSYREQLSQQCEQCDKGQYQPRAGTTACLDCPAGTTTETPGNPSISACKIKCQPGHFYNESAEECSACPQGYYQDMPGHFFCMPCPPHASTALPGSNSSRLCFDDRVYDGDLESDGLVVVSYHHDTVVKKLIHKNNLAHRLVFLSDIMTAKMTKSRNKAHGSEHSRYERSTSLDEQSSGSGSGDCSDEQTLTCNVTQDCVISDEGPVCQCKPSFTETPDHVCIPYAENQKMYLTVPLDQPFDEDLDNSSGATFKTFQADCAEAFSEFFKKLEAYKQLEVLSFRPAFTNTKTLVVIALTCTINVTEEINIKVAQMVLGLEKVAAAKIGGKFVNITSYIGIFMSLAATNGSDDDVNWCQPLLSPLCDPSTKCVDTGLRYICEGSTTDSPSSPAGAIAGGVIGAVAAVLIICVVIFFIIRRRRQGLGEGLSLRNVSQSRQVLENSYNSMRTDSDLNLGASAWATETLEKDGNPSAAEDDPYEILLEGLDASGYKNVDLVHFKTDMDDPDNLKNRASNENAGDYETFPAGKAISEHPYAGLHPGSEETGLYETLAGKKGEKRGSEHVYAGLGDNDVTSDGQAHEKKSDGLRRGRQTEGHYENLRYGPKGSKPKRGPKGDKR